MRLAPRPTLAALSIALLVTVACGGDDEGGGGSGSGGSGKGSDPFGNATEKPPDLPVPSTRVDGGFLTGGGGDGGPEGACGDALKLTIRDFTEAHPDFEHYTGDGLDGIVEENLGADHKPVYASTGATQFTTSPADFDQWYRDVDGVNQRIEVEIRFMELAPGEFAYDNGAFFPIDGMGFGNGPNGADHNFLFTTEAHTAFTYVGGEVFTFRGDDDLWVFVNGKLAVDLGGLHPQQEETVDFDANRARLGLEVGKTYPMDIFHAERHTSESNFRIQTTIDLSCIENLSVD